MSTVLESLEWQLKQEGFKESAQSCMKVYNAIKSAKGSVSGLLWNEITSSTFIGNFPNYRRVQALNKVGELILKGLDK